MELVGADEKERPDRVDFIGSVKWRDNRPFDRKNLTSLSGQLASVPGADDSTLLLGVSRAGFDTDTLDIAPSPEDLMEARRHRA